jgi:hypothetical protein
MAKICANRMYGYLEDLSDGLAQLKNDENLDMTTRMALGEYHNILNDVELLDEIIARLGCIKFNDGDDN